MRKVNELSYKDLKDVCNPNMFKFDKIKEVADTTNLVYGQDRGIRALEFGVNVDLKGYNLYLEGPTGVGKTMYTKKFLQTRAAKEKVPNDWCYIYNFNDPNEPIAVSLPAGQGKVFKETMDAFIRNIRKDIKKTFNNDEFEKEKKLIKQEFEEKKDSILVKLNDKTLKHGFQVKSAQNGIYMMPVYEGKTIEEEEYEKLPLEVKSEFESKSQVVQEMIFDTLSELKIIENKADKKIEEWKANIALLTVNIHVNNVKANYKRNKKINNFLDNVKKDILKNVNAFMNTENENDNKQQLPPQVRAMQNNEPWLNYRVNLFVDNSNLEGAPVIMDSNYTFQNIFGKLEYENQYGIMKTDFTMLKPGLLQKANGGYIIFQARDLLSNPQCYENLKKVLLVKEVSSENSMEQRSSMMLVSLKPEPIPLDLKVIMIGNSEIYHTLLSMDDDFRKLFKIKVEFEEDAPKTEENIAKLVKFVRSYCEQEDLLDVDKEAMARIVEYASKLSGDKEKLSTQFSEIGQIVGEASTWAKLDKSKIVTQKYVQKAFDERIERIKKYDTKYSQMIKEGALLINTEGYKVGQINGLTVITIGDYSFGKPSKITANTYIGRQGIVNIEREVQMSGSTHSKGVMILTGYIGELFAQDKALSLNASICFEQLYGGVDGDSASSTEAYAILSSLSEMPINQSIAVTGSVNQKGEIQPIGGVNEKIEGFFQICKMRGLSGEHGVIIPIQNVRNLHLNDEVVDAVKNGLFHIYAISTIDEGIEILTGVPAGKKDKYGKFPAGTINYLANEKLTKYAQYVEKNKNM
jgi:lon-related putative ATP-dependent protease